MTELEMPIKPLALFLANNTDFAETLQVRHRDPHLLWSTDIYSKAQ